MPNLQVRPHVLNDSIECSIQFTSRSDFSDSLTGSFPPSFPSYLLDNFSVAYSITKCVLQQYSIQLDDKVIIL